MPKNRIIKLCHSMPYLVNIITYTSKLGICSLEFMALLPMCLDTLVKQYICISFYRYRYSLTII